MNRYKAHNPLAAVTALFLSVVISATSLMAYTGTSIADLGAVNKASVSRSA